MSKHTPTPWTYLAQGEANEYALVTEDGGRWVLALLGEVIYG